MHYPILSHPFTAWIAFYSQTGSELYELSKAINRTPTVIITDNPDSDVIGRMIPCNNFLQVSRKNINYQQILDLYIGHAIGITSSWLCTLHGWLNIIPKTICEKYPDNFYNGHPGLINLYPELKGKDPQLKILNSDKKYLMVGSVVHKVSSKVDDGEILTVSTQPNTCMTDDDVFRVCKETSLEAWKRFWQLDLNNLSY